MANSVDSTLSVIDVAGEHSGASAGVPALFVLLEASRPRASSSRHLLGGIDVVLLGRGTTRSAVREGKTLRLTLPDRWMSSTHAKLECRLGRWVLTDQGSKNGTAINGEPVRSAVVSASDVIGVGHSLLRLRLVLAGATTSAQPGLPLDVDLSQTNSDASAKTAPTHPAFVTLLPDLASELAQAARLAKAADIPFLIRGESGTGKEVLASAVHTLSGRGGDLVAVNCGAIPANLVESELFGHVRGAFSGAITDKLGLIRSADGGTLLLDEIGDLALASQTALLRVLQEREVHPVGGTRPVPVDLRVLSATHRDLDAMVADGSFRGDLYARLAGYSVSLPALRDRADDIGVLVSAIFSRLAKPDHPGFTLEAAQAITSYHWPMNIRELEGALRAAIALAGDEPIGIPHLPAPVREPRAPIVKSERDKEDEDLRVLLDAKLRQHGGNVSAVARDVGKDRKQIQRWLQRLGIDLAQYR